MIRVAPWIDGPMIDASAHSLSCEKRALVSTVRRHSTYGTQPAVLVSCTPVTVPWCMAAASVAFLSPTATHAQYRSPVRSFVRSSTTTTRSVIVCNCQAEREKQAGSTARLLTLRMQREEEAGKENQTVSVLCPTGQLGDSSAVVHVRPSIPVRHASPAGGHPNATSETARPSRRRRPAS